MAFCRDTKIQIQRIQRKIPMKIRRKKRIPNIPKFPYFYFDFSYLVLGIFPYFQIRIPTLGISVFLEFLIKPKMKNPDIRVYKENKK